MSSYNNQLINEMYDWLLFVVEDYNNFVDEITENEGEVIARGMDGFFKIDDESKKQELFKCIIDKLAQYLNIFNIKPKKIDNIKIYYFFGFCAFEIFQTPHPLIWAIKAILAEIEENCHTNDLLQNIMIDKIIEIIKENNIENFKQLYGEYGVYTSLSLLYKHLSI